MDHVSLLQTALELLLEGEAYEAAHAFHSLAEELEDGADLDPEETQRVLDLIKEMH